MLVNPHMLEPNPHAPRNLSADFPLCQTSLPGSRFRFFPTYTLLSFLTSSAPTSLQMQPLLRWYNAQASLEAFGKQYQNDLVTLASEWMAAPIPNHFLSTRGSHSRDSETVHIALKCLGNLVKSIQDPQNPNYLQPLSVAVNHFIRQTMDVFVGRTGSEQWFEKLHPVGRRLFHQVLKDIWKEKCKGLNCALQRLKVIVSVIYTPFFAYTNRAELRGQQVMLTPAALWSRMVCRSANLPSNSMLAIHRASVNSADMPTLGMLGMTPSKPL